MWPWMHISVGLPVLLSSLCLSTAVVTARLQLEESAVLGTSQAACHRILVDCIGQEVLPHAVT